MKKKKSKKKNGLVLALFIAAILMAVGYAAYSQDLYIDAVGGIINDWRLEWVPADSYAEFRFVPDTETTYDDYVSGQGVENETVAATITTETKDNDLIIGIQASFSFPDEPFVYLVTAANFSETWQAEYSGFTVEYDTATHDPVLGRHITWYVYEADTVNQILDVSPDGVAYETSSTNPGYKIFYLVGIWDLNTDDFPAAATKSWDGQASPPIAETYKEEARIILTFDAV